jgi:uncharacterized protein
MKCLSSFSALRRVALFPSIRFLSSVSSLSVASSSVSSSSALQSPPTAADPRVLASAARAVPQQPPAAQRPTASKIHPLDVSFDFYDLSKSRIQAYSKYSFDVNDVELRGSVFVLPHITLLWKPRTLTEVDIDSLKLLELANPRIEYLIIGVDEPDKAHFRPEVRKYLLERGCTVEIMQTTAAIGTFTFLNDDDRSVAVALLREHAFEEDSLESDTGATQAAHTH